MRMSIHSRTTHRNVGGVRVGKHVERLEEGDVVAPLAGLSVILPGGARQVEAERRRQLWEHGKGHGKVTGRSGGCHLACRPDQ